MTLMRQGRGGEGRGEGRGERGRVAREGESIEGGRERGIEDRG